MGTASASAGSSSIPVYRLVVRMDDGTVQTIDQDNRAFRAGDRIRITTDGHVVVL
jgi:outer membrane lipoprotein SlyB